MESWAFRAVQAGSRSATQKKESNEHSKLCDSVRAELTTRQQALRAFHMTWARSDL